MFIYKNISVHIAYWDLGNCGKLGNNFNWNICGERAGTTTLFGACPLYVDTVQCRSGRAIMKNFRKYYVEDGCMYFYYAEYACTGKYQYISRMNFFHIGLIDPWNAFLTISFIVR